ncbi:MAG: DDE-type integrase/transposase/recombinase [Deltaproteobacteria bacterium]|nr:DDE-type integrase/transposase/recombinase [Deltaproteobacteria bacterium]
MHTKHALTVTDPVIRDMAVQSHLERADLTAVMDRYSRYLLSWEVLTTMDDVFCVNALQSAIRRFGKPDIFNTDQGTRYTGNDFTGVLKQHQIRISMDGMGRCMDNIFIERLWRSVKHEEIYIKEYSNTKDLINALKQYFEFHNFERPHQSLNRNTPAEIYFGESAIQCTA